MQSQRKSAVTSRQGYIYAIVAAVLFGASTPASKWLLGGTSPWLLAGLLYLGSGVGLFATRHAARLMGLKTTDAALRGSDWLWLAAATLFGGILAPALLMTGLTHADAASASLLLNLEGVFTASLAWFVFNEQVDRRIVLGIAAILAGGILLSWSGRPGWQGLIGPTCVAAACLCWAIDNNLTKKISARDALQIAMSKGLVAGATNTVLALSFGHAVFASSMLLGATVIGFFGYGLSLFCFVIALRYIGAARTGAYFSLAPFVGAAIALLAGREGWTWQLGGAGLLMGMGVWCHLTAPEGQTHLVDDPDHERLRT